MNKKIRVAALAALTSISLFSTAGLASAAVPNAQYRIDLVDNCDNGMYSKASCHVSVQVISCSGGTTHLKVVGYRLNKEFKCKKNSEYYLGSPGEVNDFKVTSLKKSGKKVIKGVTKSYTRG